MRDDVLIVLEVVRTEGDNVLMGEHECSQMRDGRRSVRLWVGALSASLGAAVIGVSMVATRSYVKAEVRESMMKEQMVVQNAKEFCSEAWKGDKGESCSATKCCKTSGYQCFEKTPGVHGYGFQDMVAVIANTFLYLFKGSGGRTPPSGAGAVGARSSAAAPSAPRCLGALRGCGRAA